MTRRDNRTMDIFRVHQSQHPGGSFSERTLRAQALNDKISLAVSEVLEGARRRKQGAMTRNQVATSMSALGVPTTKHSLDDEAAQSKVNHKISVERAVGLMRVTGDYRLLDLIAAELDMTIVPRRFRAKDIEILLNAWSVTAADEVKYLKGIAQRPGALREMTKILKLGSLLAAGAGESRTLKHFEEAVRARHETDVVGGRV